MSDSSNFRDATSKTASLASDNRHGARPARGVAQPSESPVEGLPPSEREGAAPPLAAQLADMLHAGHLQLAESLDAIESEMKRFVAQTDHSTVTRRVAHRVEADVERARAAVESLTRLLALPRSPLRLGQVEVSDLLIVALSRWKTRAPQRTFELALPGHEPTLLADGALVEQAVEGLIAWATAHSGPGDIRVSLRAAPASEWPAAEADADEHVAIAVRCPLQGPEAPRHAQLFERFDTPQADGAGAVELALARAIAARHGGQAWAESDANEQTVTLTLALPTTPHLERPHPANARGQSDEDEDALESPGAAPALARTHSVIAVAHPDARMARYLRANLEAAGFSAKTAANLGAALKLIDLEEPDLILLDLALPDDERREPLPRVLARTAAPIIALGQSGEPAACVAALDGGAADFISQPLSVEETLARVRRALRPQPGQTEESRQRVYTCGDLVIDDAQRLVTVGGAPAPLSKTEYRLLRTLAQHTGKTLSHETLLAQVWGPAYSQEIEFVWVYIRRLRRKIEPDPAHPRYILTAPGIGYRLATPAGS
ncbi:MAG TPA: winged helix-turn-helix domain-containing protein [Ktedonobacterales bacterium]